MKSSLATALVLGVTISSAQAPANPPKSPNEVVAEFFQFEANGGRLTTDGWHRADKFFVHPIPPPHSEKIFVVSKDYSVWDDHTKIKGNTAVVTVGTLPVGDIDPAFHFARSKYYKGYWTYDLILTETHSEPSPNGGTTEARGAPEWRIKEPDPFVTLTVATAIRYVTEMRDKTTDPTIKKNADETLAKLKSLR
jgi:hypothetical protein